ncbi:MAG: site-specific integrase [Muribaculaceae bacterium]|nr:site-specific integrase [Muribaculaceae bacterium]
MANISYITFLEERINLLEKGGRHGTALTYRKAKSSLSAFLKNRDLKFSRFDAALVEDYNFWLLCRGVKRNTISFYNRILRAVYNKGVKRGFAVQCFPFRDAYTGVDRTRKRCVGCDILRELKALSLNGDKALILARDIFLFGIYARGMAFVDMAFLRKCNVKGGVLKYIRRKTGQEMTVRIESPMTEILKRYAGEGEYLFPVMTPESPFLKQRCPAEDEHLRYSRILSAYNYRLRRLSEMLDVDCRLTSYTGRHTWASLARKMKVPLSVISEGMGHTSERTTEIYLASLDMAEIDRANRKILASI